MTLFALACVYVARVLSCTRCAEVLPEKVTLRRFCRPKREKVLRVLRVLRVIRVWCFGELRHRRERAATLPCVASRVRVLGLWYSPWMELELCAPEVRSRKQGYTGLNGVDLGCFRVRVIRVIRVNSHLRSRVRLREKTKKKLNNPNHFSINPSRSINNPNTFRDHIVFHALSHGEHNAPLRISI